MCAKVKISIVHHSLTMLCLTMMCLTMLWKSSLSIFRSHPWVVRHIGEEGGADIRNFKLGGAERGHNFVV